MNNYKLLSTASATALAILLANGGLNSNSLQIPLINISQASTSQNQSNITTKGTSVNMVVKVTSSVNLRTDSTTSSAVLSKLPVDTVLNVTHSYNTWYRVTVQSSGQTGWVSNKYVTEHKSNASSNQNNASVVNKTQQVKATASVNIRENANTSSAILGKLQKGTTVTSTHYTSGWYKIKTSNNIVGWVSAQYIETISNNGNSSNSNSGTSSSNVTPKKQNLKCITTTTVYSIRNSTTGKKVGTISKDTVVQSTHYTANWYKVKLSNGKVGWVKKASMNTTNSNVSNSNNENSSNSNSETSSSNVTAKKQNITPTVAQAAVREHRRTGAKQLGLIKKGTVVQSTHYSPSWYKVKLSNGTVGWVKKTSMKITNSDVSSNNNSSSKITAKKQNITPTVAQVAVRANNTPGAKQLDLIKKGTVVQSTHHSSNWYKVNLNNGKIGWVQKKHTVTTTKKVTIASSDKLPAKIQPLIAKKDLAIRSGHSRTSALLLSVKAGTKLQSTHQTPSWYRVEHKGVTGWVYKDSVKVDTSNLMTGDKKPNKPSEYKSKKLDYIYNLKTGYSGAKVRYSPNSLSGVHLTLNKNVKLKATHIFDGYYYVTTSNGNSGWISKTSVKQDYYPYTKNMLSPSKAEKITATKLITNRYTPVIENPSVAVLPYFTLKRGVTVTATHRLFNYYYIRTSNNSVGWVHQDFLSIK